MTTAEKLNTIHSACSDIKQAIIEKGQNPTTLSTFASAIGSIETGSTPTGTLSITANGSYDVTNYANADVSVSGGGGNRKIAPYNSTIEYFDDLPFAKVVNEPYSSDVLLREGKFEFTTSNMIPVYKTNLETLDNAYLNPSYANLNGNVIFDFVAESYVGAAAIRQFYSDPSSCPSVLNFGAMTTVNFQNALQNLTNLQKVLFPNVTSLFLRMSLNGCTNLSVVDMPKVNTLPSNALAGSSVGGAFQGTAIQTLSFPALNSTSFGSYTNQFNYMLKGVTGCTVHFPSNLQSVIGSWSSVTSGFSGTNTTVLFDLPATT